MVCSSATESRPRIPVIRTAALALALLALPAPATADAARTNLWKVYKSFSRLTREPRIVSRELAMLCIAPPPEAYAKDTEKYGPHSMTLIHIYANRAALPEMAKAARRFPVGAIIVKEKHQMGDARKIIGIGAMEKMPPGYDPAGDDWKYFYSTRPGEIAEGRLTNCRACHMNARAGDHVYFRADSETQP